MKGRSILMYVTCTMAWCMGSQGRASVVDFQLPSVSPGTVYGASAPVPDSPGDVVLTQAGIRMSVEEFFIGSFVGFFRAEVGGTYDDAFPTTPLELDNISVRFDFARLGFDVTSVTLDYREFGGSDNFAVNGSALINLGSLVELPSEPGALAEGITATVVEQQTITLEADIGYTIDHFLIGGQELTIDNVAAVPEPTTLLLLTLGALAAVTRRTRPRHVASGE